LTSTREALASCPPATRICRALRGYLAEEERDSGAALKKAIEGVISDIAFELQSEMAERSRTRG
jgi:hypothetical protein